MNKLSVNVLTEVYQFLDLAALLASMEVCSKWHKAGTIDYVWKVRALDQWLFVQRKTKETWRDTFKRRRLTEKHMKGGSAANYLMAPLRAHQELITHTCIVENLVFSADESGLICVWFLNPDDQEEAASVQIEDMLGQPIEELKYFSESGSFVIITSNAFVAAWRVETEAPDKIRVDKLYQGGVEFVFGLEKL